MNNEIPIRVMESDTPETNAKERPIWPPNTNGEMFMVPSDFARKLERERDEAREKFDIEATEHMLAVNKLCGERDEARGLAEQMSESNQVLMADVKFYRQAWEQLKKEAK
jgi:hypothetical protein